MENIFIGKKYKRKDTNESYFVVGFSKLLGEYLISLINEKSKTNKSIVLTEEQVSKIFEE